MPLTDVELEETQTFIAKAGAYAYSLLQRGVTDEAKENIQNLSKTAEDLTKRLWEVKQRLNNGEISFETLGKNQSESDKTNVGQDISVIEQEFPEMGRLIYDGPFSDHITQMTPLFLENAPDVTQEVALENAQAFTGENDLKFTSEGGDKIPVYNFSNNKGTSIQITKKGGYTLYMEK